MKPMKPALKYTWETFLRVSTTEAMTSDEVSDADDAYLISKGVESIAPYMMRLIRDEVLPLIRSLQKNNDLEWFSFLLHSRESGVPTTEDDKGVYIHLRLSFNRPQVKLKLPRDWVMTRSIKLSEEIGGVDGKALVGGTKTMWLLIGAQAALMLDFVEAYKPHTEVLTLIKQTRQFLHYSANMFQMKVQ